jgi:phosphate acetyltransferase
LIFPNLSAGNAAYKAVQRFAHANAYGSYLQGLCKTVSDLSRGSSVDDILGVTTMAVLQAQYFAGEGLR